MKPFADLVVLAGRLGHVLWQLPDPPTLRSAFRDICRRSMQFTALVCLFDALLIARLDQGPWLACVSMSGVALLCASQERAEAPTRRVVSAMLVFGLSLTLLAALLSWRYGSAAGFHWPLFTLLLVKAVVPRLHFLMRGALMLPLALALLVMGEQPGQVLLDRETLHRLAVFNFGVMAVSSLSLVMHYRALVQRLHEQLSLLAETDALTGLLNRRALSQAAARLRDAQARQPGGMSLLLIDLDHFKQLNDHHGHEVGDQALQHVGMVLTGLLRRGDLAARWGGEEFLLLLSHSDLQGAGRLAERLLQALRDHPLVLASGLALSLSATVGVVAWRSDEVLEAALRRADLALYDGKRNGRNRVILATA